MQAHRLWQEHGCPKHGPIYDAKRCAKAKSKQALRNADRQEIVTFSNDLHEYLNKKDQTAFWHTWNAKFGKNSSSCPALAGYASEADASTQFADICKPNNESRNEDLKQEFISRIQNYSVHSQTNITVELIDRCIRRMKTGKAAGSDRTEAEHLLNAHPILVSLLNVLFNAIKYKKPEFYNLV